MTKEEKQLLLKNICSRFLYGVICTDLRHGDSKITEVNIEDGLVYCFDFDEYVKIENCRLYLRPMSSMTEAEAAFVYNGHIEFFVKEDYCNKHHLDYWGLIEKDLALEAPSNMYNKE